MMAFNGPGLPSSGTPASRARSDVAADAGKVARRQLAATTKKRRRSLAKIARIAKVGKQNPELSLFGILPFFLGDLGDLG
ncbi:MAG TPA: hypothetical protein VJS12_12960, partial [Steroidobacteraceae bacterium]|nr:hypothetical protein [Steroidobacteraceae bacterium]